ncbi:hypothetical protein ACLS0M_10135 [Avibacterium avium]|uniref:hypothetical protein n=1 Tax=Avibacterium avium TaxID=751 RepID=UPI003BF86B0C
MKKPILLCIGLLSTLQSFSKQFDVYLDYATLPSLNMMFDLVEKKDNQQIERIIGFERFNLSEDKLSAFPQGKISFSKVSLKDFTAFSDLLVNKIAQSDELVELFIHTNLDHSFYNLPNVLEKLSPIANKFTIKHLYLYDDGSMNYKDLYEHREQDIKKLLASSQNELAKKLASHSNNNELDSISRYTWHKFFPTDYILLRPDYLTIDEKMQPLKEFIGNNVSAMSWSRFEKLSPEQKTLFLKLVNVDENTLHKLKNNSEERTFIFTGTTTWEKDKDKRLANAKTQVKVLEDFLKPDGKFYLGNKIKVFFKGHPKGDEINEYILKQTGAENIPANIPFEVLMMTNSLPDYVGGIMSSMYFSLPATHINKVIFLDSDKVKNKNDAKAQTLSKLMLMLNVITPEQIAFEEIPETKKNSFFKQAFDTLRSKF